MAIIHVTGLPRHGKSSYVVARTLTEDLCYFNWRYDSACKAIKARNAKYGLTHSLPPQRHVVFGNLIMWERFPKLQIYPMNGWEFGANNSICPYTKPLVPYGVYVFDEARKYFGSKADNKELPPWVTQGFEQHGHIFLKIILITHRPEELNKDIRPICEERIHIEKSIHYYRVNGKIIKSDKFLEYGILEKTVWYGREFGSLKAHEDYVNGNDPEAGKPFKYTFFGAINEHYNPTQYSTEMENLNQDFRYFDDDVCDERPKEWSNYKRTEKKNGK